MHKEKAGFLEKLSFGSAAMGCEMEACITISYFALYCTEVLRLDAAALSVILLATKLLDGVTDLIITHLADRTQSRYGKYRPWVLVMGLGLGLCTMACYSTPAFLKGNGIKTLWVVVIYICTVAVCETGVFCPVMTLNSVVSADYYDRLEFTTARSLGENVADVIISAAAMPIILAFGRLQDPEGWRMLGLLGGVGVILFTGIGFLGTKERLTASGDSDDMANARWKDKVKLLKGDVPYAKLMVMQVCFVIQLFVGMLLFSYFCIHCLGHEDWVASLTTIGILVQMLATLLFPALSRRMDKNRIVCLGSLILLSSVPLLAVATGYGAAVAFQILRGIGNGLMMSAIYSSWPDACEHVKWKTGIFAPGIVSSVGTLFTKAASGIGNFLAVQILNIGSYVSGGEVQSEYTLSVIRNGMMTVLTVGGLLILVVAFSLKEYSRERIQVYQSSAA